MPHAHDYHDYPIAYGVATTITVVALGLNVVDYLRHQVSVGSTLSLLVPAALLFLITLLHRLFALVAYESSKRSALLDAQIVVHEGQVEMNRELLARLKAGEGQMTISGEGRLQ